MIGRNFADCSAMLRARLRRAAIRSTRCSARWHAAYDAIVERDGLALKPGVVELLDWLDARGHSARRRDVDAARARARRSSRDARCCRASHALVGGDEVARGKPAPDIYLEAARRLGVAAARVPRARGFGAGRARARSPPA